MVIYVLCVSARARACVCAHYAIVTHSYTSEPGELHEFAEDKEPLLSVLNGDLHHTHKQGNDHMIQATY